MSMEDMEHMVVVGLGKWSRKTDRIPVYIQNSHMYPAFMQFNSTWEFFIDSLMNEWRTFNIVSILLSGYVLFSPSKDNDTDFSTYLCDLRAILTLLQINTASSDPLIRSCALLSLVCAMMSLLYACMYIVRFAMMRKAHKALEWAEVSSMFNLIWFANTLDIIRRQKSPGKRCCGMSGYYSRCLPYGYPGKHLLNS
jgi:hypothetical protein